MNTLLQLRGRFDHQKGPRQFGPPNIPVNQSVKASHIKALSTQLSQILQYWEERPLIQGALVSAYYNTVVAKSNRIKQLLCTGNSDPNDSIRGSKFYGSRPTQHVFIYYVKLEAIRSSIKQLDTVSQVVEKKYNGVITHSDIAELNEDSKVFVAHGMIETEFAKIVVDSYHVERFTVDDEVGEENDDSIVTFYQTDVGTKELLENIGIDIINAQMIDETTIRLSPREIELVKEKVPYLIAMEVHDLQKLKLDDVISPSLVDSTVASIPAPTNEPIVGVIDTPFCEDVYFGEWVTYVSKLNKDISIDPSDYNHGTEVTSIIVDGPQINPQLDDGCGRFRVRHFGVATGGRFSSFSILKAIREIVAENSDIKVWNLSLGSLLPIKRNFISPEGAELDRIQSEYDVIFVVAGTNRPDAAPAVMPIGAPADSLNSVTVNAVDIEGKPASYHRVGPVLSFFHKPDISCYGGDIDQGMRVCTPVGEKYVAGTSFSAPWISRKMAYLICVLGFTREVAKALLIDAAAGWDSIGDVSPSVGYGIVPKRIEDILQTPNDEIKFIMTGSTDAYETYTYRIPVPVAKGKQPFYARATLCYFPRCVRNQGVDYTSTEMDIHFGRVNIEKNGKIRIKSINANLQGDTGSNPLFEEEARKVFRKWDNIKLIGDILKSSPRPRKVYGNGDWGLSIRTKERLKGKNGHGLTFGVVVTLKEMTGENRIGEFIKACQVRGWIVQQLDIENQLDIHAKADEDIFFD